MRTSETSARAPAATNNPRRKTKSARSVGETIGVFSGREPRTDLNVSAEDAVRLLVGMIRRTDHRTDRGMRETQAVGFALEQGKGIWMDVAQHRQGRRARPQGLA